MKGKIIIDRELCKGCGYCINACSQGLISFDRDFNTKGYQPAILLNSSACDGCGLCAIACPDIAIEVWRKDTEMPDVKCADS